MIPVTRLNKSTLLIPNTIRRRAQRMQGKRRKRPYRAIPRPLHLHCPRLHHYPQAIPLAMSIRVGQRSEGEAKTPRICLRFLSSNASNSRRPVLMRTVSPFNSRQSLHRHKAINCTTRSTTINATRRQRVNGHVHSQNAANSVVRFITLPRM